MIIKIHEGSERVNDVWSALSDGTRREILTMLRDRGEDETFRYLREAVLRGLPFAEEEKDG